MAKYDISYRFEVTGAINVPADAELVCAQDGAVIGFIHEGKQYHLLIALEIDGGEGGIIVTDDGMGKHGFNVTDYDVSDFKAIEA